MNTGRSELDKSCRRDQRARSNPLTAKDLGIKECKIASTDCLVFSPETRLMCEQNVCGLLGKTWACPPAVGSYDYCVKVCRSFKQMMVFSTVTDLKGQFNPKGWHQARIKHEKATEAIAEQFRIERPDCLVLSTEGCEVCSSCTYPDAPCPYPEKCFPSVEGYGILVLEVVKRLGMTFCYGPETLAYFSFILF